MCRRRVANVDQKVCNAARVARSTGYHQVGAGKLWIPFKSDSGI
jgi:hypothetical protein